MTQISRPGALIAAARAIALMLRSPDRLTNRDLSKAMIQAFGGNNASGAWMWKFATDAMEAASVFHLLACHEAGETLDLIAIQSLVLRLPSHSKRSEESQALQQFSTPLTIGSAMATAAMIRTNDVMLEPSAGTGLLAVFAAMKGASLHLNEWSYARAELLKTLFPDAVVTQVDGATLNDRLPAACQPSLVIMNPPFSVGLNIAGRYAEATFRHVHQALLRLRPGGRLVMLTGERFHQGAASHRASFARLAEFGQVVFSAPLAGALYARHGTSVETRLTVIDKYPGFTLPARPITRHDPVTEIAGLHALIAAHVPDRFAVLPPKPITTVSTSTGWGLQPVPRKPLRPATPEASASTALVPVAYEAIRSAGASAAEGQETKQSAREIGREPELYAAYALGSIKLAQSVPHPTTLVESAAMAAVAPPTPTYVLRLPKRILDERALSDPQMETVIAAGEAHGALLPGWFTVSDTLDHLTPASPDAAGATLFRRGFFLGDGTGAGKGRQVAGILADNWHQGRKKALWFSKSDKLIDDAQRDWAALGESRYSIIPLSRFTLGAAIPLKEGIVFATYATLRSEERPDGTGHVRKSRLKQLADWCGPEFDGVIIFDEAHELGNAAGTKSGRGDAKPSQQGKAGLHLQRLLPHARIVYVSATGASQPESLAYAERLGLWGSIERPFATREQFVSAVYEGGIAAMEVVARDLKALGLYTSRSLSYAGIEIDLLNHHLSPKQIQIYDAYADAFQVIHSNLTAALAATNITSEAKTFNRNAKAAAMSAFESSKQRFFNYLLTSMMGTSILDAMAADLAAGKAVIGQIVSTSEALLERRLAAIPVADHHDVQIDTSPREYVLEYLASGFPVNLFEIFTNEEGNEVSKLAKDVQGNPIVSREALEKRDQLIEHVAGLPPLAAILDQIIHRFGADQVAEVTGRNRRVIRKIGLDGIARFSVAKRSSKANLVEAAAFMNDEKRILIFSEAGGTGRSYHADRNAKNQRQRVHYLIEAGWRVEPAVQGLGRSNRTNQATAPIFRPCTTDVKGQKRFISTIARRLDALGAITRGQRQTGGQGLFRPEDNLEGDYARLALQQLYRRLHAGKCETASLTVFETMTGLSLCDQDGTLKEELPPITTFLNRLLALPIAFQNGLFTEFEALMDNLVMKAKEAGTYDVGVETLQAERLTAVEQTVIKTHANGATTELLTIDAERKVVFTTFDEALSAAGKAKPVTNGRSGAIAIVHPTASDLQDDGNVVERIRIIRPHRTEIVSTKSFAASFWREVDAGYARVAWDKEIAEGKSVVHERMHLVTGMLLPIWKELPPLMTRIYRALLSDGRTVIGRLIDDGTAATLLSSASAAPTPLSANPAAEIVDHGKVIVIDRIRSLRRSTVMGEKRIELIGFNESERPWLKTLGVITEIIAYQLRLFVPVNANANAIIGRIADNFKSGYHHAA
jgi:hypothetical protein